MTDQNAIQPDKTGQSKTGRKKLSETVPYVGTPGAAYADDFLPGSGIDDQWIADAVNTGALLVCPRCFFLHLPAFALPLRLWATDPEPVDACDVCAHALAAAEIPFELSARMMQQAREELAEARAERARLFFELWLGASNAADTWVLAALGDALADVKEKARKDLREKEMCEESAE